jgi:hypothetical protein
MIDIDEFEIGIRLFVLKNTIQLKSVSTVP